jgi:hypothetical protein
MSTTAPGRTSTMRPAPARTGAGPVPVLALVLALLLLALAVVLVRDALVGLGTLGGSPWLPAAVEALVGVTPSAVVVVVGVVVALVGLWLLLQGFHRRTRTEVSVRSQTGVFTGTSDVARLASGAARGVDGVLSASSSAGRSSVTVKVVATGDVQAEVQEAVSRRLSVLDPTPRVRVRATSDGSSS